LPGVKALAVDAAEVADTRAIAIVIRDDLGIRNIRSPRRVTFALTACPSRTRKPATWYFYWQLSSSAFCRQSLSDSFLCGFCLSLLSRTASARTADVQNEFYKSRRGSAFRSCNRTLLQRSARILCLVLSTQAGVCMLRYQSIDHVPGVVFAKRTFLSPFRF